MVLSVIAMSGLAATTVKASASAGDLIKMAGNTSVYYLGSDGKRYVFPNSTTYFSWYPDFSGVITIPATELQSYPLGGNVTMRAGTKLVKITTDPSVYAVQPNGVLTKIGSEAQAASLYGTNWSKRVVDVPDAFFTNYTVGAPLATGAIPAGSLVMNAGSSAVYYFDGTNYLSIPSEGVAAANNFNLANAITVSNMITANGTVSSGQFSNVAQSGGNGGIVVTGSGLMVSLNANTAPAATLIATEASANLASFNFTAANDGAVTVNAVKVHRVGLSSDSNLDNVYLYNGSTKLTDAGSVSGGYVTFSNSAGLFTVAAGSTMTITVRADIDSAATSGNIAMAINAASDITASAAGVTGSFPVVGNTMSLITAPSDLATASFGNVTIPSAGGTDTIQAGTMGATVWSAPLSVNQKAVTLSYVSFRQVGSINSDALQNIKLFVNGTQVGNSASIDANNRVTFDLSANPITLQTGQSTVELRADIVKGSSRTYSFNLQLASDILLTDTNYGVSITTGNGASTYHAIGSVGSTTVSAGSISIAADPNFTTNQVVKNASNVVLAQYTMKAYGEDMQVNNITLAPSVVLTGTPPSGSIEGINQLAVFVNGAQVGSSQNYNYSSNGVSVTWPNSSTASYGTNNIFTIPAGTTVTVQVKGNLNQLGTTYLSSVQANINSLSAQGVSSVSSFSSGVTTSNQTLTVTSGNLTVALNNGFGTQNVVQNVQKQEIGSFVLQTGSAEGVTVNSLSVSLTASGTAITNLANLYISDNTTPIQPQSGSNNFNAHFTIAANSTHEVDVFADLGSIATGTTVTTSLSLNAVGASTNSTTLANGTGAAVGGQTLTITNGALSVPTLVSNNPTSGYVVGGATQPIANYNFVSQNGSVNISDLWFNARNSANTVEDISDLTSITVNGSTAPVVNGVAHVAFAQSLTIPAGLQGVPVPVTATYANVSSSGQGGVASGNKVVLVLSNYKYIVGSTTLYGNVGVTDGTWNTTVNVPSNLSILAASVPTVTLSADNTPGVSAGYTGGAASELLRFTVSNGGTNQINLKQITVTPNYSGALTSTTTQLIYLYDRNDLNTVLATSTIGTSGTARHLTLTANSTIAGNSSEEYVVKVDTQGTWTSTGTSIQLQLTAANDTISGGTDWQWNDSTIAGYLNGYLVKNLPLTGQLFVH